MTSPDQLERDLAQTRTSLNGDVNELSDRVSPAQLLARRSDRIKQRAAGLKDKVMGAAENVADGSASDRLNLDQSAGGVQQKVRSQVEANPVAAGLIAFGVGWLLSSLVPATQAEQKAAAKIEDNAGALVEPLKQSAQEVAGNLQQPIQDAAESVKQTATDAAGRTAEHAKSAAADVQQTARDQSRS